MKKNEKYSERFCNKENEVVSGVFNSENWGKRTSIMKLKEKFNDLFPKEFGGMQEPLLTDCEQIADDYAIEILESYHNTLFIIPLKEGEAKRIFEHIKKEKGL